MATATQPAHKKELDPRLRSSTSRHFEDALREKIVGQNEAVQALAELHQVFCAGLHSPGRPVGNLLFLGPTGSGKTRIVEAAAEILFGDAHAVIKVDCAEFQHSHEISKIIGSPPGYLGHRETHPMITQEALAASHTDKLKLSFLLFDEIEKAQRFAVAVVVGDVGQGDLDVGGQPESGFVTDRDFPDVQPWRGRNQRVNAGGNRIYPAEGQASNWVGREGGEDGDGSGAEEVFAGVYEPARRSGRVSPIEVRRT
jgi:DNA polymerase III delta prime subunit